MIRYGPAPDDTGPYYAYEARGEDLDAWRERVRSDIEWGQKTLAEQIPAYRPLAFSPPYGNYGQDGTNDERIPGDLLGWLTERYRAVFTQDKNALARAGSDQPLGRIQVTRKTTGASSTRCSSPASSDPRAAEIATSRTLPGAFLHSDEADEGVWFQHIVDRCVRTCRTPTKGGFRHGDGAVCGRRGAVGGEERPGGSPRARDLKDLDL